MTPLYASESECARAILGDRHRYWPAKVKYFEGKYQDFPKFDEIMGGRYMPAVKLWFDRYNRIALLADAPSISGPEPRVRIVSPKPDGKENYHAEDASTLERGGATGRRHRSRVSPHSAR